MRPFRRVRRAATWVALIVVTVWLTFLPSDASAADGDLDVTFGSGGLVVTDSSGGGTSDEARAVAVADDGSIAAVGMAVIGAATDVVVVRYTDDGRLDPGFGEGGVVTLPVFESFDIGFGVSFDRAGRIVVAAQSVYDGGPITVLLRLLPDGQLDASFGDAGRVVLPSVTRLSLEIDD